MIKIFLFLLSSAFESIGGKYYPCQILSCNSNGKLDYFERNFHIRFAAITQFKNVREQHRELGRGERDVMLSLHFRKESSPLSSNYHSGYSGTGTIFGRYRGRTRAFQLLFLAFRFRQDDKMTSREASRCTKFVGSSSCCLSNGGRILRTFGQLF